MLEFKLQKSATGSARVIMMMVLVLVLAGAYVGLDFYVGGEQLASTVEGRGGSIVSALSRHKLESGNLPDALVKLTPKYLPALLKCPNGQPFGYKPVGAEYTLSCEEVLFKMKPYQYDSKSRAWSG